MVDFNYRESLRETFGGASRSTLCDLVLLIHSLRYHLYTRSALFCAETLTAKYSKEKLAIVPPAFWSYSESLHVSYE